MVRFHIKIPNPKHKLPRASIPPVLDAGWNPCLGVWWEGIWEVGGGGLPPPVCPICLSCTQSPSHISAACLCLWSRKMEVVRKYRSFTLSSRLFLQKFGEWHAEEKDSQSGCRRGDNGCVKVRRLRLHEVLPKRKDLTEEQETEEGREEMMDKTKIVCGSWGRNRDRKVPLLLKQEKWQKWQEGATLWWRRGNGTRRAALILRVSVLMGLRPGRGQHR